MPVLFCKYACGPLWPYIYTYCSCFCFCILHITYHISIYILHSRFYFIFEPHFNFRMLRAAASKVAARGQKVLSPRVDRGPPSQRKAGFVARPVISRSCSLRTPAAKRHSYYSPRNHASAVSSVRAVTGPGVPRPPATWTPPRPWLVHGLGHRGQRLRFIHAGVSGRPRPQGEGVLRPARPPGPPAA